MYIHAYNVFIDLIRRGWSQLSVHIHINTHACIHTYIHTYIHTGDGLRGGSSSCGAESHAWSGRPARETHPITAADEVLPHGMYVLYVLAIFKQLTGCLYACM